MVGQLLSQATGAPLPVWTAPDGEAQPVTKALGNWAPSLPRVPGAGPASSAVGLPGPLRLAGKRSWSLCQAQLQRQARFKPCLRAPGASPAMRGRPQAVSSFGAPVTSLKFLPSRLRTTPSTAKEQPGPRRCSCQPRPAATSSSASHWAPSAAGTGLQPPQWAGLGLTTGRVLGAVAVGPAGL